MAYLLAHLPEPPWLWLCLAAALPALLAADLLRAPPSPRAATYKTLLLAGLAGVFGACLATFGGPAGPQQAAAFFAAWLVELALSVDNLFVFLLLFAGFDVHGAARARVLSYGVLGALLLRFACIALGVALVRQFAWLFYVFGAILLFAGGKLLWPGKTSHAEPAATPLMAKLARRLLPMASAAGQARAPTSFVLREHGRFRATNLGVLLIAIEASDLLFALDSVPAGFAITSNGWLLCASNALAILGLRSLFVALNQALGQLRYLPVGLAVVLLFIGGKMLLHAYVDVSMQASLIVIVSVLFAAVVASLLSRKTTAADASASL